MPGIPLKFKARVWLYDGHAAWHFVTLPKRLSADIQKNFGAFKRGWGSLRATITTGRSTWKSSIFPDKKAGAYLLPLKAEIRAKEKIKAGESRAFLLEIEL